MTAISLRSVPLTAIFGIVVILAFALTGIFANLLAPYGETQIVGMEFEPWGGDFVLGTDSLGRDMLSRLIYGARNSIGIALATTIIAFVVGAALGTTLGTVVGAALGTGVVLVFQSKQRYFGAVSPSPGAMTVSRFVPVRFAFMSAPLP